MNDFEKILKKSYEIENTDFIQLYFPINHMIFISAQYQLVECEDKDDFKRFKLSFHVVLGKKEEEDGLWLEFSKCWISPKMLCSKGC